MTRKEKKMATQLQMHRMSREVVVKIAVENGRIVLSEDPFYVSNGANEEVKWVAGEGV